MKPVIGSLSEGEWVGSASPGLWKVVRVLKGFKKLRFDLSESVRADRRQLVLCKRLLNEDWRPAYLAEFVNGDFIRPLSTADRVRLRQFIADNPLVMKEFDEWEPKTKDFAMDLPLEVPVTVTKEAVRRLASSVFSDISIQGFTNDQILTRIAASDLSRFSTRGARNATLRFLSNEHELRNNEFVFRKCEVL